MISRTKEIINQEGWDIPARVLDRVTVNVGKIRGGEKVNMVPGHCEAEFDLRIPLGLATDSVLTELKDRIHDQFPSGVTIALKTPPNEANHTDPDEPFVQALLSTIREVTGSDVQPALQWASSDARFFRYHSIPTAQFGPCEPEGIHGYNERIAVKDVANAARVYALLAHDFLSNA